VTVFLFEKKRENRFLHISGQNRKKMEKIFLFDLFGDE
jgi:hypothetical protein